MACVRLCFGRSLGISVVRWRSSVASESEIVEHGINAAMLVPTPRYALTFERNMGERHGWTAGVAQDSRSPKARSAERHTSSMVIPRRTGIAAVPVQETAGA